MKLVSYHRSGLCNFEVDPRDFENVHSCPLKSMIITCNLMTALNTTHNILQISDRNHEVQYPMSSAHCLTMCSITVLCGRPVLHLSDWSNRHKLFHHFPFTAKIAIVPVHYPKWTICYSALIRSYASRSAFQLQSVPKRCIHTLVWNIKFINLHV